MPYRFRSSVGLAWAAVLCLLAASPGWAWEDKGHQIVNGAAIDALPAPLRAFYQQHRAYVVEHSVDPDLDKRHDRERKARGEPLEGPRHFIDLDRYGPPPFRALPEDYAAAVEKYGKSTVDQNGTVPWRIEELYRDLVTAFRQKDGVAILHDSAWLGHYVADAHVPFHATENYDGQLTGQPKIHAYFERDVLTLIDPAEIRARPAQRIHRPPHELAFDWLRESYRDIQPLLDADAANGGKQGPGDRNLTGFAKTARPIAIDRLTKAATRLASLWYSAWIEAGRPDLRAIGAAGIHVSPSVETTIGDRGRSATDGWSALRISAGTSYASAADERR